MPHPSGRPWIIAHRGASAVRRGNTIEAFTHAAALGADAVELDVRRTADGVLVVHHDPSLPDATTPIIAMTATEVKNRAPWVPTFAEAAAACADVWMDIEVKNAPYEPDWDPDEHAVDLLAGNVPDGAMITSFNPASVAKAHGMGMRTGLLLIRSADPIALLAHWPGYEFILPSVEMASSEAAPGIVAAATAAGTAVAVWTVDDPEDMRRLADTGVDAICTNRLDLAVDALSG